MINEKYKKQLIDIILKRLPTCGIYIFGSRVHDRHRPGADVDLALDAGSVIEAQILRLLRRDIDDTTIPLYVDLIDVHNVDQHFLNCIKQEWQQWH